MRTKKGFTLIELLVVVAVIALLMGILMPALMRAKDMGKRMVCMSHLRTLAMANVLYAEDADGWYVPIMDRVYGTARYWPSNQRFRQLVGYKSKQGPGESEWHAPKEFRCPSDLVAMQERTEQYTNWLSYGCNLTDWYSGGDWYGIEYAGHKTTTVPTPATELVFTESNDWWALWKGANYVDGWDVLGHDTIMPYKNADCPGPTLYRHGEGANMAFYDGHVAHMKKDKVWSQDAWDAGTPGMWSIFKHYPPTEEEKSRLPTPPTRPRQVRRR